MQKNKVTICDLNVLFFIIFNKHLDGRVPFDIPEGTQTGREFVLRDKGIPDVNNPRRRGNHRFTVVVETPTRLTKEQKELLRQLEGSIEETPKIKKFFDNLKDFFD